jgi:hypothetical protein
MFDAGNIGSNIAQVICSAAFQKADEINQQKNQEPAKPAGQSI